MMEKGIYNICILEDDVEFSQNVKEFLQSLGYRVSIFNTVESFMEKFSPYQFDAILLDLKLKEKVEGFDVLKWIMEEDPDFPVIVLTNYGELSYAIKAIKLGAKEFLVKTEENINNLPHIISKCIWESSYRRAIIAKERELERFTPTEIVGESPRMLEVKKLIQSIASDGKATVLITGETGTGKELVARAIHRIGPRKNGPFIAVNLAGIPKDLVASHLFGHEKGAFTGAIEKRKGFIEEAHKGILFLDEIGELPMDVQVQLLRVLEERKIRRLGSVREIPVDFQLIAATHQDMEKLIKEGKFRQDLYYRLNVFKIELPPLREHKEDIPLLTNYFLQIFRKEGRTKVTSVSPATYEYLTSYDWPGNVRELRNVIETAIIFARESKILHPGHLPEYVRKKNIKVADNAQQSIHEYLAEKELEYLELLLVSDDLTQSEIVKKAGYESRFQLRRRLLKIKRKFPHLIMKHPIILKKFRFLNKLAR